MVRPEKNRCEDSIGMFWHILKPGGAYKETYCGVYRERYTTSPVWMSESMLEWDEICQDCAAKVDWTDMDPAFQEAMAKEKRKTKARPPRSRKREIAAAARRRKCETT